MKWRWLLLLCIPNLAVCQGGGTCNTAFSLGDTHVILSVVSSGIRDPEPASRGLGLCGNFSVEGNLLHRMFPDVSGQPYFGYDLQLTANLQTRTVRVQVMKPHPTFTAPAHEAGQPGKQIRIDGTKLRSFTVLPAATTVSDGDRVDVPVFENRSTGDRFLDSYAIALPGTGVATAPFVRDGFPGVAPVGTLLHLEQPRLGRPDADVGSNLKFGMTGPVVWVYCRSAGRFLFSATPRPGYRRLGVADGSVIRFTHGVEQYRLDLQAHAVDQPGSWWIWVRYEADFSPPPEIWTIEELRRGTLAIGVER